MDETLKDIRSFVAREIREGFESAHAIVEAATNYACETHGARDVKHDVARITAELLAEHQGEQATWVGPTDCDLLDEAFDALNQQGIVARQNFSCCNNCGFNEIWGEVEKEEVHQPVEGYVFYHLQATERVIRSGQLLMTYGCVEDDTEAFDRVARKIVVEVRRAGLDAHWGGTPAHPIVVDGIVWRCRR